jgi:tRNA threonylcarbamoyladenosine biosynthesis protein TsaB
VQGFTRAPFAEFQPLLSLTPEAAAALIGDTPVIGSGLARLGLDAALPIEADARDVLHLPPAMASLPLAPLYGRGPDAKLPK